VTTLTATDPSGSLADAEPKTCPRCKTLVTGGQSNCTACGAQLVRPPIPRWHLPRRLYDWTLGWAYRPSAGWALFILSFAESSFFPVPPDVLLMPLVLGNRKRWFRYALLCSIASVLGACLGFLIGWGAWGALQDIFFRYIPGFTPEVFARVSRLYEQYNFWIVFTAGFTPIPFKVITITAGVFGTGPQVASTPTFFAIFLTAAVVSRSARFFLVAGLMRIFGPRIAPFIEKRFNLLALVFTVLLVGGFVVIKYVV